MIRLFRILKLILSNHDFVIRNKFDCGDICIKMEPVDTKYEPQIEINEFYLNYDKKTNTEDVLYSGIDHHTGRKYYDISQSELLLLKENN